MHQVEEAVNKQNGERTVMYYKEVVSFPNLAQSFEIIFMGILIRVVSIPFPCIKFPCCNLAKYAPDEPGGKKHDIRNARAAPSLIESLLLNVDMLSNF
jgi:hypothetical protein